MEFIRSLGIPAVFSATCAVANFAVDKIFPIAEFIRKAWISEGWDKGSAIPGAIQLGIVVPATSMAMQYAGFGQWAVAGDLSRMLLLGGIAAVFSATVGHMIYWRISDWFNYHDQNLPADLIDGFTAALFSTILISLF